MHSSFWGGISRGCSWDLPPVSGAKGGSSKANHCAQCLVGHISGLWVGQEVAVDLACKMRVRGRTGGRLVCSACRKRICHMGLQQSTRPNTTWWFKRLHRPCLFTPGPWATPGPDKFPGFTLKKKVGHWEQASVSAVTISIKGGIKVQGGMGALSFRTVHSFSAVATDQGVGVYLLPGSISALPFSSQKACPLCTRMVILYKAFSYYLSGGGSICFPHEMPLLWSLAAPDARARLVWWEQPHKVIP